jgi:very-short-patch-repair endonuclease
MGGQHELRRQVAALAGRQHVVATRQQLVRLGVTDKQVEGWVKRGELRILHRGVYLVGPADLPHTREMAAVLACGAGAVISHRSSICLLELLPYPAQRGPVHVTVPGRHIAGPAGILVHKTCDLRHYEIRACVGIPCTAPIRTLIDFAGDDATDEELERAVAEAFALRLTQRAPLLREMERQVGRRGTARLRELLDGDGPKRTRSTPERTLLKGLRAAGVDGFEANAQLGRWEGDFYWSACRLVVEVDAYSTHSSPTAFERDRLKSAELNAIGLLVHRVTRRRIDDDLANVVAEIRRLIERRSS